jgi:hypothetical protein
MSSVASHERVIHQVGISKLKARLQKAAESGETLNIMKYFFFLSFVCAVLLSFALEETDQKYIHIGCRWRISFWRII